jgi:phosphoribosylformylglycinamidine synthase
MGAAGITCSTAEMAAKGGVGVDFDLDRIPVREQGMVPYEYLLSESQERMLFVAHQGREQELIDIFHRWGLQAVVAGQVIAEPIVRIRFQGKVAAEVPATALSDNTPIYERTILSDPPHYAQTAWTWMNDQLPACQAQGLTLAHAEQSWTQVLKQLLATPSIASKRWVYRQYDHQVQNNTVVLPGGADAAVVRLRPVDPPLTPQRATRGVAATVDCNARYVYLDPYEGAKATVAEAARNLSCVGAEPIAVTDNLNFGSPEKLVGYWQLAEACRGLAEGCRAMGTPVTGGNVSLYNETLDANGNPQPIYPTPVVGMVGLIPDLQYLCGQGWQQVDDLIYLLGVPLSTDSPLVTLGGTEYLAVIHHTVAGRPPRVDFELEKAVQTACRHGIRQGWVRSAHDIAEGGIAVALAEACIAGQFGAALTIPEPHGKERWDTILFGEGGARILMSVNPAHQSAWEAYLHKHLTNAWQIIGCVTPAHSGFQITTPDNQTLISATIKEMASPWLTAIERQLQADAMA